MTTLISFYTQDWEYPKHAARLRGECESLGMPCVIEELPSTGSYLKNTCLKPQFILDKLLELKSPVLWVDVDGSLVSLPDFNYLETFYYDFAARKMAETRKRTWHVGTMWFNYTENAVGFLRKWIENTGNLSDESALEKTWQERNDLVMAIIASDLPEEYFIILKKGEKPRGVICHRISDGESKRKELPDAIKRGKEGIY